MNRFQLLSIIFVVFTFASCNKENNIIYENGSLKGTWNITSHLYYDSEGHLEFGGPLDTPSIKLSIDNYVIQYMEFSNYRPYYLLYFSYEFYDGILMQYPDSLLDYDLNMYYWNPIDSSMGDFVITVYPFSGSISRPDSSLIIESRNRENGGSLVITYEMLDKESIDLRNEFDNY